MPSLDPSVRDEQDRDRGRDLVPHPAGPRARVNVEHVICAYYFLAVGVFLWIGFGPACFRLISLTAALCLLFVVIDKSLAPGHAY